MGTPDTPDNCRWRNPDNLEVWLNKVGDPVLGNSFACKGREILIEVVLRCELKQYPINGLGSGVRSWRSALGKLIRLQKRREILIEIVLTCELQQ